MKIIYSCLFGKKEELLIQNEIYKDKNIRYLLFTDLKGLKSNFWEVVNIDKIALPDRRASRLPKIMPYKWLPLECKQSIYIDNSVLITSKLENYWDKLEEYDFLFFPHPSRENVKQEVAHLNNLKHYEGERMKNMILEYQKIGFDLNSKIGMGTILIRNHSKENLIKQQDIWIQQVLYGTERDQISLGYSLWRSNVKYEFLKDSIRTTLDFKWPVRLT